MNWLEIYAVFVTIGALLMVWFWLWAEQSVRFWRESASVWRQVANDAAKLLSKDSDWITKATDLITRQSATRDRFYELYQGCKEKCATLAADCEVMKERVQKLEANYEVERRLAEAVYNTIGKLRGCEIHGRIEMMPLDEWRNQLAAEVAAEEGKGS